MTRRFHEAWVLSTVAMAIATAAAAAGPELRIAAQCDVSAPPGGVVVVGVEFRAGVDDASGRPNEVSGLDFTLEYDPATFEVEGVSLAAALAGTGRWSEPATPEAPLGGALPVQLVPRFQLPLPTLTDGRVVDVRLAVKAEAAAGCHDVAFAEGSVVFSAPPLGRSIPPGAIAGGGVLVDQGPPPESCNDCTDNDRDGATDLEDPECAATGMQLGPSTAKRRRRTLTITGELPEALTELADPVRVTVSLGRTIVVGCAELPAAQFVRNGKRLVFKGNNPLSVKKLILKRKNDGTTRVRAILRNVDIPAGPSEVAFSLHVGERSYLGVR